MSPNCSSIRAVNKTQTLTPTSRLTSSFHHHHHHHHHRCDAEMLRQATLLAFYQLFTAAARRIYYLYCLFYHLYLEFFHGKERKGKEEYLYSAFLHQGTHKALRDGSHSFTCKQHHACLSFVSVHQMSPPQQLRQQTSSCSSVLIY